MTMRLKLHKASDTLCIRLSECTVVASEEIRPGLIVEFDGAGHLVALELLHVSEQAGCDVQLPVEVVG
jgi:hypothetical protein